MPFAVISVLAVMLAAHAVVAGGFAGMQTTLVGAIAVAAMVAAQPALAAAMATAVTSAVTSAAMTAATTMTAAAAAAAAAATAATTAATLGINRTNRGKVSGQYGCSTKRERAHCCNYQGFLHDRIASRGGIGMPI